MNVLVVRLDNAGDVLLAGPAIRAVAARHRVTVLVGPRGAAAADLLPGVSGVITWRAPWVDLDPPAATPESIWRLARRLAAADFTTALVLTSFRQSPLPTALVLRLAGIGSIAAISADYPGSLLDVRLRLDADIPEPERGLSLARAAGFELPDDDDGRLALRRPLPDTTTLTGVQPYVVAHPGASAPARCWPDSRWAETLPELVRRGHRVILTGAAGQRNLTRAAARDCADVPPGTVIDLAGRTDLRRLAAVVAGARAVLVSNTGVAHLAAAVGTPVACLFAPVVPAARRAPYRVRHVLLGDQGAACRDSRATVCPVPGHPCLTSVTAAAACDAIDELTAPTVASADAAEGTASAGGQARE